MCNHSHLIIGAEVTVQVTNWSECDCGLVRDNWQFDAIYRGHEDVAGRVCGRFDFCAPKPICPSCGNECDIYMDNCHGDTAPELFTQASVQHPLETGAEQ